MQRDIKFELTVLGCKQWDVIDDNLDVEVKFSDGSRFTATFFTLENLSSLFTKNKQTGECGNGTYLWAKEMIIVQRLDQETMDATVRGLLRDGELESAFARVPDVACIASHSSDAGTIIDGDH